MTAAYNRGKGAALAWIQANVNHQGTACLIWPFSSNWNGYGHLGAYGKMVKAHRLMCELAHGDPPTPKHVAAHSCHNGQGGCVNPQHLAWKTPSENLLERRPAGRLTKKRWTNKGRLTDEQVANIKALKGRKNQREIGAMFGISYQHVSVVQNNKLRRDRTG